MSKPPCDDAMRRHRNQVDAYFADNGPLPDEWLRHHRESLERYERRWHETGNPLWIWRALCFAVPVPDDCMHPFWLQHLHPRLLRPDYPLPRWITDYLYRVAWDITALSNQEDFRTRDGSAPALVGPGKRLLQKPTDQVSAALRFTTGKRDTGTSEFSRDRTARREERILARYDNLYSVRVRTRKTAGESVSISAAFSGAESAGSLVDGVY